MYFGSMLPSGISDFRLRRKTFSLIAVQSINQSINLFAQNKVSAVHIVNTSIQLSIQQGEMHLLLSYNYI